jgi:uncharacterized protein
MIAINVAQLLKSIPGTTRQFAFSEAEPELTRELRLLEPIAGQARLLRTARGILVRAEYHTALEMDCARCVEPVRVEIDGQFEDEFVPTVDVQTGLPLDVSEASAELHISPNHILDLSEAIRQDVLVSEPLQPLCDAACAGLCPTCGTNRNAAPCACPPSDAHPAFETLRSLLEREQSS